MSGLHMASSPGDSPQVDDNLESLWRYLRIGLVYLLFQHYVCTFFAYVFATSWTFLTVLLSGLVIGATTLSTGFTLHLDNLYSWYSWASPLRWAFALLLPPIHSDSVLSKLRNCKPRQVQTSHNGLIVQQDTSPKCEILDGELSLREIALDDIVGLVQNEWLLESLGCVLALVVITFLSVRHSTMKNTLTSVPNKPWTTDFLWILCLDFINNIS